jgi:DNA-binding IclR family transcriptional regulator
MPRAPIDRSVAAVGRALNILEAFGKGDGRVQTLDDLERETGLFKAVICRYLLSFERHGYVTKVAEGKYQLGTAVLRLGRGFEKTFDISQYVMPTLEQLSHATGESASYYVRNNDKRVCLYRVDSPNTVRVHIQPGNLLPLDNTASATILRQFSAGLQQAGAPATWVVTRTNSQQQYASMAAPIFGIDGGLAGALTVSGPSTRFNPTRSPAARKQLLLCAQELSSKLGAPDVGKSSNGRVRRKRKTA